MNRKIYFRILGYAAKYKRRFFLGLMASFLFSIFNGLSLLSLKPIFDVIESGGSRPMQVHFDAWEVAELAQTDRGEFVRLIDTPAVKDSYEKERSLLRLQKDETPAEKGFFSGIKAFWLRQKLKLNFFLLSIPAIKVLKYISFLVLPIFLLRLVFDFCTVYFLTATGLMAVTDIRRELYRSMIRLPLSYFVKEKTGVLMSRIINDVTTLSDATSNELRTSINNFFIISTHVIILAMISLKLLLITTIGVPIVLIPIHFISSKIRGLTTNEQTRLAELNGHLQEVISGIRIIRAFGMEPYQSGRFEEINMNLYKQNFLYRITHQLGPALVEMITSFIVVGLIVYGGTLILDQEMTSGSFFAFLFTLIMLLSPIKQMAGWYNLVQRSIASGHRIFEIIDHKSEVKEADAPVDLPVDVKKIEFKDVEFHYPGTEKLVLRKVNLSARRGETIALVGHSGAGKSTMVDLLLRFNDVTGGGIEFDGTDIRAFSLEALRERIGIVTQDIFLFNGTVRENLCYGRSDIPEADVIRAAKMAFADEFIQKLPLKYDTVVGERGLMLSGGQRQRLSIARAILKNPGILILDEATSALDTESERLVQLAIESVMKNRTTFVIAHRLSTIFKADQILVMKDGKIVERGRHKELLRKGKVYKNFYKLQLQH
jgi:ABC-type multidrug transport system fused ATPase/permease subunit